MHGGSGVRTYLVPLGRVSISGGGGGVSTCLLGRFETRLPLGPQVQRNRFLEDVVVRFRVPVFGPPRRHRDRAADTTGVLLPAHPHAPSPPTQAPGVDVLHHSRHHSHHHLRRDGGATQRSARRG